VIRLLSILTIILAIILFPPAVLALVSNNAVPGDATYPIKRSLEDVIYSAASLNPTSKAWFSGAKSERRYKELNVLVAQNKVGAKKTLNELVVQTSITVDQISQVEDKSQKKQLLKDYQQTLNQYDQGLQQLAVQIAQQPEQVIPSPTSVVTPVVTPTPTPVATVTPKASTKPTPVPTSIIIPTPTAKSSPKASVTPTSTPQAAASTQPSISQDDIDKAREDIKKNKEKAKEEQDKLEKLSKQNNQSDNSGVKNSELGGAGTQTNKPVKFSLFSATNQKPNPPTPEPTSLPTCKTDCGYCTTRALCDQIQVYDTCLDNLGKKAGTDKDFCSGVGAKNYRCYASDNENCRSVDPNDPNNQFIYSCLACNTASPTPAASPFPLSSQAPSSSE